MDKVYFVHAVSCEAMTEDVLKLEHKINNIRYNRNDTYEKYLNFAKSWGNDKYVTSSFLSSIHTTLEEAQEYAINNAGDINECGSYGYCVVSSAKCGVTYYNSEQNPDDDFWLYKYNYNTNQYEPLDKSAPEYTNVRREVWGYIGMN